MGGPTVARATPGGGTASLMARSRLHRSMIRLYGAGALRRPARAGLVVVPARGRRAFVLEILMLTAAPDLGELSAGCDELDGVELLMLLLGPGGPLARRTALVSSFGAESVVLLHMAAVVDPALPVVFLETGKHFPETLAYRDRLVRGLGLRDVRAGRPDPLGGLAGGPG